MLLFQNLKLSAFSAPHLIENQNPQWVDLYGVFVLEIWIASHSAFAARAGIVVAKTQPQPKDATQRRNPKTQPKDTIVVRSE